MKGKEKCKMEIQEMTICGYTQEKIAEKLNISISTVSRTMRKIRDSSAQWLTNLAERDLANIYRESLEGLRHDLSKLNDMLDDPSVKNDIKLQLQIRKEITATRSEYMKQLTSAPMVWSLEILTKNCVSEPIPQPTMKSLCGISGVKSK